MSTNEDIPRPVRYYLVRLKDGTFYDPGGELVQAQAEAAHFSTFGEALAQAENGECFKADIVEIFYRHIPAWLWDETAEIEAQVMAGLQGAS